MKVERKSINGLFVNPVQYEIPIYQRRYVWDERNWEPLWIDIKNIFEDKTDGKHFTGAIVTRAISESSKNRSTIEKYEIIDGQQRLTTFQLILCAFKNLCESENYVDRNGDVVDMVNVAKRAGVHIKNTESEVDGNEETISGDHDSEGRPVKKEVYKLLPTDYDSEAFRSLVKLEEGEILKKSEEGLHYTEHPIHSAYHYFRNRIQDCVGDDYEELTKLLNSFIQGFEVAQIDLSTADRSQEIFLSINATGRQLSEFDYLRNYVFLQTTNREDRDRLYTEDWSKFEQAPWTTEKLDKFFPVFLMAKLGRKVFNTDTKLFDLYQKEYQAKLPNRNRNAKYELEQLKLYAKTYEELDDPYSSTGERMQFYKDLGIYEENRHNSENELQHNRNIIYVQAFILHLKNELERPDKELQTVFEILESYVARRLLMDPLENTAYDTIGLFLDQLVSGDREFTVDGLVKFLKDSEKRKWPTNDQIKQKFKTSWDRVANSSLRFRNSLWFVESYILYRIENLKRQQEGRGSLQIGEDPARYFEQFRSTFSRERMIKSTQLGRDVWRSPGNLTLCTTVVARPSINSFKEEKAFLEAPDNAILQLNNEICGYKKWDKQTILEREQDLLSCFYKIWKFADEFTKTAGKSAKTYAKSSPKPTSPKWISMIQSDAYQPTRFETDKAKVLLKSKVIEQNQISGVDNSMSNQTLYKSDIIFICCAKDWDGLLFNTAVNTAVRSSVKESIKLQIDDLILEFVHRNEFSVKVLTRLGREFPGSIEDFDADAIYLKIKGYEVIVFREGLIGFTIEDLEGMVKKWGPEDLYGYIECSEIMDELPQEGGIPQDLRVESGSLDRSIFSGKLQPNLKVKFNLQIVHKDGHLYFQTSNVKLVTTEQVYQGKVKLFYPEKGSGFLTSSGYSGDIYLHKSQVQSKDLNSLRDGYPVEFNLAETVEGQSPAAINVKIKRVKR